MSTLHIVQMRVKGVGLWVPGGGGDALSMVQIMQMLLEGHKHADTLSTGLTYVRWVGGLGGGDHCA